MKLTLVTAVVLVLNLPAFAAETRMPVLVELFTSEGCSSCPPAEGMLQQYTKSQPFAGVEIIPLAWHVDYFNTPWVDPYSSRQYTARQKEYVDRFNLRSCYTPQVVVDGSAEFVGGQKPEFADAMANAAKHPKGIVALSIDSTDEKSARVKIDASKLPEISRGDTAEVLIAVAENGLLNPVKRGENAGSKLRHAAVVRFVRQVGQIDPKSPGQFRGETTIEFKPEWKRDQLQVVALVQESRTGRVIAVGTSPVSAVAK